MLLSEILKGVEYTGEIVDCEIKDVTCDSRKVEAGSVFVCVKGTLVDGHEYAKAARRAGAQWIIAETDTGIDNQLLVKDSREAYALMCANKCGRPSEKLKIIGVTGTNGKTTITYVLKHVLEAAGKKTGLIGTIQNVIGDMALPAKHTTPDPAELHVLFERMLEAKCEYVVMEISSHALDQRRVAGVHFETAIFTNLTQDHLDYHGTMENYFLAKAKLFDMCDNAVICIDDDYGKRLSQMVKCKKTTVSVKLDEADFTAHDIRNSATGCKFAMVGNSLIGRVNFNMPGGFSVVNAMEAGAAAMNAGVSFDEAVLYLSSCPGVRGRSENIPTGRDFTIIRDYAHSPDGLEKMLTGIREYSSGRVVTLFGCAGERDRSKRIKMAQIVANLSDYVILTSDNPRSEPEMQIIEDALPGFEGKKRKCKVEPDRYKAIKWALKNAKPGDILLLAGKGHEDYQVLSYGTIYFDEREIVEKLLKEMR